MNINLSKSDLGKVWKLPGVWIKKTYRSRKNPNKWAIWDKKEKAWFGPKDGSPSLGSLEE